MARYENEEFVDRRVAIDGNDYFGCTFNGCTIVYRGDDGVSLDRVLFEDCQFALEGPAGRATSFIKLVAENSPAMNDEMRHALGLVLGLVDSQEGEN
jgi:hypothetical protein